MLNIAIFMGRLVASPELKHTPNGVPMTAFAIAVDKKYSTEKGSRAADFIDIVAWRQDAEFICKYFVKGQMIAIQGHVQTRSYIEKSGDKRKVFEIVVDEANFAGGRPDGNTRPKEPAEPAKPYSSGTIDQFLDDSDDRAEYEQMDFLRGER